MPPLWVSALQEVQGRGSGQGRAGWQVGRVAIGGQTGDTDSGPLPSHVQCPGGARRCQTLRRHTFYPSGGCVGIESWRRPFPGSERQGEDFKGMLCVWGQSSVPPARDCSKEPNVKMCTTQWAKKTEKTRCRRSPWEPSLELHIGGCSSVPWSRMCRRPGSPAPHMLTSQRPGEKAVG